MVRQKDFPSFSPKAGDRSHDRRWFLHDTVCYSYPCTPHNIYHKEDMHQKRYFPCHKEVFSEQYIGDRRRCTKCKDNDSAGSPASSFL